MGLSALKERPAGSPVFSALPIRGVTINTIVHQLLARRQLNHRGEHRECTRTMRGSELCRATPDASPLKCALRIQAPLSVAGLFLLLLSACSGGAIGLGSSGNFTERQVPWVLVAQDETGKQLDLRFEEGNSCASFDRVDIQEDDQTVKLTVVVTEKQPAEGEVCQDFLRIGRTTVRLREPLGQRTLVGECTTADCEHLRATP